MPYTRDMDLPFPPGITPDHPGPLSRFLPPIDRGVVASTLTRYASPGDLLLDPFGASPRLVVDAARAGRGVLVAVNNPVTRFVLSHMLTPFSVSELQAALAALASAPKDDGRLEPFLLDLYRTECASCGRRTVADYFVWDREQDTPILKGYNCTACGHAGEAPANRLDIERARSFSRRGLQNAMAIEQVAPAGDPDREHALAAIAVYPNRAVYALITVLNKIGQLELDGRRRAAVQALVLSALDATNALWGVPEGRARPRQLIASPQYKEANLWRSLEKAVAEWAFADPQLDVREWPTNQPPNPGTVVVASLPIRDLLPDLEDWHFDQVLTVLPRQNQAFWTLSALWAAWLWGREAAAPIKVALRRRRYDWSWHASALRASVYSLAPILGKDTLILSFMPEAEPGFVSAGLAGLSGAGFWLTGRCLRQDESEAVLTWSVDANPSDSAGKGTLIAAMEQSVRRVIQARGEPCAYPLLHLAALGDLAADRRLSPLWDDPSNHPVPVLTEAFESAIGNPKAFTRIGGGIEPESGLYWLEEPMQTTPLADSCERLVLEVLLQGREFSALEVDRRVCDALTGLLTPDRRLVYACLRSYAVQSADSGLWRLRAEDAPTQRTTDLLEIHDLLVDLGSRLGFDVQDKEHVEWCDANGRPRYAFNLIATGSPAKAGGEAPVGYCLVIPGGRASLLAEKARRNPILRRWLDDGVRVIKFRHVRRLAAETTLTQVNFEERLAIDPPEHHDPQMPLL
ncbi:MAG TPA: hypothetical protein VJK02_01460 [Anaerolineales bacterium]|nr:hypothetical protein [Anaerolineales bacterium]